MTQLRTAVHEEEVMTRNSKKTVSLWLSVAVLLLAPACVGGVDGDSGASETSSELKKDRPAKVKPVKDSTDGEDATDGEDGTDSEDADADEADDADSSADEDATGDEAADADESADEADEDADEGADEDAEADEADEADDAADDEGDESEVDDAAP
jgi:hypothetical protein